MHHALARALRRDRGAIVIGADCPALRPRDLRRAARWLAGGCDVVLAPAEDGGYALIAARRVSPLLFGGIAWGGGDVYGTTVRKLVSLEYRWRTLERVWAVDRPEDLERLRWLRFASAARPGVRR
jgi:glycosyltransferase A (GT-A) superfamily protein (DUF2064 family)